MDKQPMTWSEFMRMCHQGPGLPREVLDEIARMEDEAVRDEQENDSC